MDIWSQYEIQIKNVKLYILDSNSEYEIISNIIVFVSVTSNDRNRYLSLYEIDVYTL